MFVREGRNAYHERELGATHQQSMKEAPLRPQLHPLRPFLVNTLTCEARYHPYCGIAGRVRLLEHSLAMR